MKALAGRFLLGLVLLISGAATQAHKASDSYLQVDAGAQGMNVRWDIALRDLDAALVIDADEDGQLTWGEIKAAWPRIEAYAIPRLKIDGCDLRPTARALERRNDGAYAVLMLASECTQATAPSIAYSLFREIDSTHRGIAKVQLAGQPLALAMLDPARATVASADASSSAAASEHAAPAGPWSFLREGIRHIVSGYDHVLFLLCLLLPSVMRRTPQGWRPVERLSQAVWPVIGIVSAFTVAHSITLALAAMKLVSLPASFIEPAIAATIILAALDNLWPIFPVRRALVTFFFGLIHGFGFAGVLGELDLPTAEFAWALLQFNLGLELGQLIIVLFAATPLFLLRQRPQYRGWVLRGGSYAAMFVGVLWLIERTANISLLPI